MLGRRAVIAGIHHRFEKSVPDNLLVIGPREIGKSILLKELADTYKAGGASKRQSGAPVAFDASTYWKIEDNLPTNDRQFLKTFCLLIAPAVKHLTPSDICDWSTQNQEFALIQWICQQLNSDKKRLLVVIDGLELLLEQQELSSMVWNQLSSLTQYDSIGFLVAARGQPKDHSQFWRIFQPVPLKAFEDADWIDILRPLHSAGVTVSESARNELIFHTGGVPLLVAATCEILWENADSGQIVDGALVSHLIDQHYDEFRYHLERLWDDCEGEERELLNRLCTQGSTEDLSMQPGLRSKLEQRGFVEGRPHSIRLRCHLIGRYAGEAGAGAASLNRLFGTPDCYAQNVLSLVKLRKGHAVKIHPELDRKIENILNNMHDRLHAVEQTRAICNIALKLIWQSAFPPDGYIPDNPEWYRLLKKSGVVVYEKDGSSRIPTGELASELKRPNQLRLLQAITDKTAVDSEFDLPTYVLLNSLHSIENAGAHDQRPRNDYTPQFVAILILEAIELAERVTIEASASKPASVKYRGAKSFSDESTVQRALSRFAPRR